MLIFSSIDRQAQLRTDADAIQKLRQSSASRTLLWHAGRFVMQEDRPRYFLHDEIRDLNCVLDRSVYLGRYQGIEFFACRVLQPKEQFGEGQGMALRQAAQRVSDEHMGLMFYAQGMLNWHQNHAFCSRCGSETSIVQAGHARQCNQGECGKLMYPKIDPAVIFSVINDNGAESRLLLGRKQSWEYNRYSVLAGFVEPGEALEAAVKREAWEETGLEIVSVEYFASQSWPFPDSLMMGFSCQTAQQDIRLIDNELEAADWFSAKEIEQGIKTGQLKMPNAISLSWHLIDAWFQRQQGYSLDTL